MARNIPPPLTYPQKGSHAASSKRNGSSFADRYGAGRARAGGSSQTLGDLSARGTAQGAPQPMPPKIKGT